MTDLEIIGINLIKYRKMKKYTQESLANELNMSACNIRKIELGKANPTVNTLLKIAKQLDISLEKLLLLDDEIS